MSEEEKKNIKNVILTFADKCGYSMQSMENVINNYLGYDKYNVAVSDMLLDIYTMFREKDRELMDYGFNLLMQISPTTWHDYDEQIISCEDRLRNNLLNQLGMSLEENHGKVIELFSYICNKFRELDIDYYLVGGFPCYLKTDGILRRFHSDIDFMINEKDISKLQQLIQDENWHFFDNRLDSKKSWNGDINRNPIGEHEIIARYDNSIFHIGGVCFRRGIKGELINREYFTSNDGNPMVMEIHNSLELTKLDYPDDYSEFNGILFKSCSMESIYVRKKINGRDKDKGDINFLEKYVDKQLAERYATLLLSERNVQILSAYDELDKRHCK